MAKQKNLSPLELGHLVKYRDNENRQSIAELSVEMGYPVDVLESYLEKLGGIKVREEPVRGELTADQQMVRQNFIKHKGAIIMTEGAAGLIETVQGDASFSTQGASIPKGTGKSNKSESAIFRGNTPIGGKGNPYDERRV